jgi:hypothetical protein
MSEESFDSHSSLTSAGPLPFGLLVDAMLLFRARDRVALPHTMYYNRYLKGVDEKQIHKESRVCMFLQWQ